MDENVQGVRVENRRPSDVFLALWRYHILNERSSSKLEDFAQLADVWQQIREMEAMTTGGRRRRPRFIDDLFEPDDRPKPKDPKKQGVVSIYYEVKEPGHVNVAIDCPERMPEDARQAVLRKVWARWHAEADEPREGQDPPLQTPPETVSESVHALHEDPGDPSPAAQDDKEDEAIDKKGFAARKQKAMARLETYRNEGVTLQEIADAARGLTITDVMNVLDRKPQAVAIWSKIEKALDALDKRKQEAAG